MTELLTAPAYPLWAVILAGILGAFVARLAGGSRPAPTKTPETEMLMRLSRLGPQTRAKVVQLVADGRLIEAVRDVRQELGCGLKEAKDIVDRITAAPK